MVALVTVALLGSSPAAVLGAARSRIKVAIVVGPVGSMTDYYRGLADDAAAVARRSSDDVVTVYTPNATWPRVRRALQGASIVVYLGHGNGWPSALPRCSVPANPERPRAQSRGRRRG